MDSKPMKNKLLLITFIMILLLFGCSAKKQSVAENTPGNIPVDIHRIISTAPSNTEIIADLGMAHKLVAIDRHSVNIKAQEGLPEIPGGIPLLDFFFPDAEVIVNLNPDLILASGHNPTGTGEDPFRVLSEMGIPVVYISMSTSIEEIYSDIALIAELLGAKEQGKILITSMKAKINEITTPQFTGSTPGIYFEISAAPEMMTFGNGNFIHDMIEILGGQNIFEDEHWLVMPSAEAVIERNPEIIFTNVNYIDNPIAEIKSRPGFENITAVRNNRIYRIDADSSVRASARIVLALQQMAEAINE